MSETFNRRACLGVALAATAAAPVAAEAPTTAQAGGHGAALSARSHFYARPQFRQALSDCFVRVLGCPPPQVFNAPGLSEPILAFAFPGGGSVSVEFTPAALAPAEMRHGAWLEIRTAQPEVLQRAVLAAGLPQVRYVTSNFYFEAPGGQVFGIARA